MIAFEPTRIGFFKTSRNPFRQFPDLKCGNLRCIDSSRMSKWYRSY